MAASPGAPPRRAASQLFDSADDMQSAGSQPDSPSQLSVSEFGDLSLRASSSAGTSHAQDRDSAMGEGGGPRFTSDALGAEPSHAWRPEGVVEREDSASYQRRPPALAERQDSASNLQALAEAEAELVAGSRSEAADLSLRRDSAADMHIREAPSDGHSAAGDASAVTSPSRASGMTSGFHSVRSSLERPPPAASTWAAHERSDSASDIPAAQPRPTASSPRPLRIPGSAFTAAPAPFLGDSGELRSPMSPSGGSGSPSRASLEWSSQNAGSNNTLAAARRLVSTGEVGTPQTSWSPREPPWGTPHSHGQPSSSMLGRGQASPSPQDSYLPSEPSYPAVLRSCDSASQLASPPRASASELDITYRQDSALDSLAAARQAVLQELPQAGGSSPMEASQPDLAPGRGPMQPTGDPLVQARWLVANWEDPGPSSSQAAQDADRPSSSTAAAGLSSPAAGTSAEAWDYEHSWEPGMPVQQQQDGPWTSQSSPALEQARALLQRQLGSASGQPWLGEEGPSSSSHAYPDSPIDTGPPQAGVQSAFDVLQGARQAKIQPPALLQQDVT